MTHQSAMPPYFTWLVDKLLAVSALPYHHTHLNYLTENGLQQVVVLLDKSSDFRTPFHTNPKLKVVQLSPRITLADCHIFVSLMQQAKARGEGVLVCSVEGLDAASVLAACYLINLWQSPADFAIDQLRVMRPTSLRVLSDENLVHQYYSQVAGTFKHFYADTNLPKWEGKTSMLGQGSTYDCYVDMPVPESYQQRDTIEPQQPAARQTVEKRSVRFA